MKRGRPPISLDLSRTVALYESGKSLTEVAVVLGVGRSTVQRRLVTAGHVIRDSVESTAKYRHLDIPLGEDTVDLMDGMLLGDAHLDITLGGESRLQMDQRSDRAGWLQEVKINLDRVGVGCSVVPRNTRPAVTLRTQKYVSLTQQRTRWYPQGTKIVPRDIRLTPVTIAHWYWGDGSVECEGYRATFCTDGFPTEDVEFLQDRLNTLYGMRTTIGRRTPRSWRLCVGKMDDRARLLEIVRPFCPECFRYKLDLRVTRKGERHGNHC